MMICAVYVSIANSSRKWLQLSDTIKRTQIKNNFSCQLFICLCFATKEKCASLMKSRNRLSENRQKRSKWNAALIGTATNLDTVFFKLMHSKQQLKVQHFRPARAFLSQSFSVLYTFAKEWSQVWNWLRWNKSTCHSCPDDTSPWLMYILYIMIVMIKMPE